MQTGGETVTTTYAYDNAHNRTAKTVTHDAGADVTVLEQAVYTFTNNLNQISVYHDSVSGKTVGFTYDLNGNRVQRAADTTGDSVADEITVYTYDAENRLLTHEKTVGGAAELHQYAYDYRTRRVLRDESGAGRGRSLISFSGGLSVQEWTVAPAAVQPDPAADILDVLYVRGSDYGGGIGGVLYTLRDVNEDGQLNNAAFNHYNSRGDVVARMDDSGVLLYQAAYEAFGRHGDSPGTQEWGGTADRQQANTKDEDPTGLLNEGFRYRCLETGVFITRDPLGFVDGPNVYTYVVQNPWTFFDPLGLRIQYGDDDATDEQRQEIERDLERFKAEGLMSDTFKVIYEEMRDDPDNTFIMRKVSRKDLYGGKAFGENKYYFEYNDQASPAILAHEAYHALQARESDRIMSEGLRPSNNITRWKDPLGLGVSIPLADKNPWAHNPVTNEIYQFSDPGGIAVTEHPAIRIENRVRYELDRVNNPNSATFPDVRLSYGIGVHSDVVVAPFGVGGRNNFWGSVGGKFIDQNIGNYNRISRHRDGTLKYGSVYKTIVERMEERR